jgi:hypothetical protein
MIRRYLGLCVSALLIGSINGVLPSPTADADELCAFTLSPPQLIHPSSGVDVVTATLTPGICPGKVAPQSSKVCVFAPGQSGRCQFEPGPGVAHVYLEYTQRGVLYQATGTGCSRYGDPVESTCSDFGPQQARL